MRIPRSSQAALSISVSHTHNTSVDEIMPVPKKTVFISSKTAVFCVAMLYLVLKQTVHLIQRKFHRDPFPVFECLCLCRCEACTVNVMLIIKDCLSRFYKKIPIQSYLQFLCNYF